ncbi:MAG: hypothetical protein K2G76_07315 [Prevotella sp.]|nr:hypothetical protein [Prevotella sp.]
MKIKRILTAAFLLPLLWACQSESYQEIAQPQQRVIKVGAYLSNSNDTRAQVKYGTEKAEDGEIFIWTSGNWKSPKDYIFLFNITKLAKCPFGIQLEEIGISSDGKRAEFEPIDSVDSTFAVEKGDVILAMYGETLRKYGSDSITLDTRNIFTYVVGTEANKPQIIVKNPNDSSLCYMADNLKMYDMVTVAENNQVPDLHFKHLSALMRVTLRNETGGYIYPTKLEFKYPGTESFFNTTMYFSVDSDTLKVYDDGEFYNGSAVYTDNIGTTINTKTGTDDTGDSIASGKSYELYLSTVPRIRNAQKGDSLEIHIIAKHNTDNPYSITIPNFKTVIEAGKRYWFDLTAIITPEGERKLVLTSEWEKQQQNEQGTTEPEAGNE